MSSSTRRTRGMALAYVLVFAIVAFPLVFGVAWRSLSSLKWVGRVRDREHAFLLADEGMSQLRSKLLTTPALIDESYPGGDGRVSIRAQPPTSGPVGQPIYFVGAEGSTKDLRCLVVSQIEVDTTTSPRVSIERNRTVACGDTLPGVDQLATLEPDHQARVAEYQTRRAEEAAMSAATFLDKLSAQVQTIPCPDLQDRWSELQVELNDHKYQIP